MSPVKILPVHFLSTLRSSIVSGFLIFVFSSFSFFRTEVGVEPLKIPLQAPGGQGPFCIFN